MRDTSLGRAGRMRCDFDSHVRRLTAHAQPFDLDARVVETGTAGDVGQTIGAERIRGLAIPRVMAPQPFGQDNHAAPRFTRNERRAVDFAQLVVHPHPESKKGS